MTSASFQKKIDAARRNAPHELPKARLCANVVLSCVEGAEAIRAAILELKESCGSGWSHVAAFQFMSGRRGEFAADCAEPAEQVRLHFAHLVAKYVCDHEGLGNVSSPDTLDFVKFRALAESVRKPQT